MLCKSSSQNSHIYIWNKDSYRRWYLFHAPIEKLEYMVQVTSLTEKEFSDTNFETRKSCQCFDWMLQSSSGWNIGKVFQSQSWYQRTLFSVYAGAIWEATISKWLHGINCSLSGHSLAGGHFSPPHFMYRFDSNEHYQSHARSVLKLVGWSTLKRWKIA